MDRARHAMAKGRRAVLAEGYLDVIALHRAGVEEAVAPLGTALGPDHAKLLRRWAEQAVLVFDGDRAGIKASERSIEVLELEGLHVSVATLPDGADPDTMLERSGAAALRQAVDEAASPLAFRLAALRTDVGTEDPGFWKTAVQLLAQSSDLLERAAHVERLAAEYPGTRDLPAARAALEAMVEEARPRRARPRSAAGAAPALFEPRLRALEALPFLALAQPRLAAQAWEVVRDPDVFHSSTARRMAQALLEAFGEGGPSGAPSVWLSHVADVSARGALEEMFLTERGQYGPIEEAPLAEAARRLRHRRALRERKGLRDRAVVDDSALAALSSQLHGSSGQGI
jgi:DNA primase